MYAVVQGIPLVQIGDKNFWFGRPKLILHLIHFTLFQNAFEITFFLWTWDFNLTIARVVLGVAVQFLCSYITLHLYALVSQMGSHMKRSIFDGQTSKALKNWHKAAKKKQGAATRVLGQSPVGSRSGSSSPVQSNALGTPNNQIKKTYLGHEVSDEGFRSPSLRPIFSQNRMIEQVIWLKRDLSFINESYAGVTRGFLMILALIVLWIASVITTPYWMGE